MQEDNLEAAVKESEENQSLSPTEQWWGRFRGPEQPGQGDASGSPRIIAKCQTDLSPAHEMFCFRFLWVGRSLKIG